MRAYTHKEKKFCAVFFKFGDWTVHKMTKAGEVHHGFAPAHAFVKSFNEAIPIVRKQSTAIPASGWKKHTIESTGSAKSSDELFEMIFSNKL